MRHPPIELVRGELRVSGTPLQLDARRRAECAFVSHAHGDHIGRHDRTIATAATLALMNHRLGEPRRRRHAEHLPAEYRKPFGLGELTLELFPAGHVLGSAQLRVTLRDGRSLGYTGDLCTDTVQAAEPAEVMPCDALVIESTFGLPRYVFPPKAETLARVKDFVDGALSAGVTPVLYAYSLGKSQEILAFLSGAGYAARVHPTVHAINRIYEAHGVALPGVRPLDGEAEPQGEVVVVPQQLAWSPAMRAVKRRRTAVLTGWALDGERSFRGVDAAFPLSDHADHPSLVAYARATGASRVFTVHCFTDDLAASLRRVGIRAEPLREQRQLELL
jgi:putative mRNA 3-end processing factor